MSRDSQKTLNPSQPCYVLCNVTASYVLTEYLWRKYLGIAFAGAAGLKELVRAIQATMPARVFAGTLPFSSTGMEARY